MHKGVERILRSHVISTALVLVCILGVFAYLLSEKRFVPKQIGGVTAYYYGLEITDDPRWHGRVFTKVVMQAFCDCSTVIDVSRTSYCEFETLGPDNLLRGRGRCLVTWLGLPEYPLPSLDSIEEATYWNANGVVLSQVQNGIGKKILASSDGKCIYTVDVRDSKPKRITLIKNGTERELTH